MSDLLPLPGSKLDGYTILRELGRGGMGAVFLAEKGAARFAIKVLLALDPEQLLRFEREARAMAAVDRHPNIVTIHTLGRYQGLPYVVMDYVEGGDLRALLKARGALESEEALELMTAVAEALGYVHERGIVHRDLKPENILIREDGQPIVTDFGLARGGDLAELTRTGFAGGTPHYMAPEQIEPGQGAGPATDVWALGVILLELLTGRRPFRGANLLQIGRAVLHSDPEAPKAPEPITAVISRALSKDPMLRFADARAFKEALDEARGELAPQPRWPRRAGVALALAAVLAAALPFLPYREFLPQTKPRLSPEGERYLASLRSFDEAFLRYGEALIGARLKAVKELEGRAPSAPERAEALRALKAARALAGSALKEAGVAAMSAEEQRRLKVAGALIARSAARLPELEDSAPFDRLARLIFELHCDSGYTPGRPPAVGGQLIPEQARLLQLFALLAHAEAGEWLLACRRAEDLAEDHGERDLEATVLKAGARAMRLPRDRELAPGQAEREAPFWRHVLRRARGMGEAELEAEALLVLAELDLRGIRPRLTAALEPRSAAEKIALCERLQGALVSLREALGERLAERRARVEESLLEQTVVFIDLVEGWGPARSKDYTASLNNYLKGARLDRSRGFQFALKLKRLFPEQAVSYPVPSYDPLIGDERGLSNFLALRLALFDVGRQSMSYPLYKPELAWDMMVLASREGAYIEAFPAYLLFLRDRLGRTAVPEDPAEAFVLAQIDLNRIGNPRGKPAHRPLFEQLRGCLRRVFEAWGEDPRRAPLVSIARYYRYRWSLFGIEQGWLGSEEDHARMLEDMGAVFSDEANPYCSDALVDLYGAAPHRIGGDRIALFDAHLRRLIRRLRLLDAKDPEAVGPWPPLLPLFSVRHLELELLEGLCLEFLEKGQPAAALEYLDRFEALAADAKRVHSCRAQVYLRLGQWDRALEAVKGLPNLKNEYLIEVRAQAYSKLGQREKAIAVIDEHFDPQVRARLKGYLDGPWSPGG